jgi:hypothetical protein
MFQPQNTCGKLEWFRGDANALAVYRYLVDLSHIWDDLVDKDKPVKEESISYAFSIPLFILPANPFWREIEPEIRGFWVSVISSYMVANAFERSHDHHKVEIAHGLRYAVGQIFAYIFVRFYGLPEALPILEESWQALMSERFSPYFEEHCNGQS